MPKKREKRVWLPVALGVGVGGVALGVGWWMVSRKETVPTATGGVWELEFRTQPFRAKPGVIVCVPDGFKPSAQVDIVIYWRGNGSCIRVIAGDENGRCRPGGNIHRASQIVSQFKQAKKNAVLVIIERIVESSNVSDFGRFDAVGFSEFLGELVQFVQMHWGVVAGVSSVSLYAHSGGWAILAQCLRTHPVVVRDVVLLDAFYGDLTTFTNYARSACIEGFPSKRFVSVHTGHRPTDNTIHLVRSLQANFPREVISQGIAGTPTAQQMQVPVFAKTSALEHSDVPSFYFGRILESSFLTST